MLSPSTEYQVARSCYKCRSSNLTGFLHQNLTAANDQEASGRVAGACDMYIALLGYTLGKLHPGCRPKRWNEDILSHLNLNLEGAMRTAQDKIHWKTMIGRPNIF